METMIASLLPWVENSIPWAFLITTAVEFSPIKVNPLSSLFKRLGKAFNSEVMDELNDLKAAFHERAAKDARVRILRFGDELLHGTEHSKEHFDQILQDITEYDEYCREHPDFKNNMTRLTTEHIMKKYSELYEERRFL